MTRKVLAGCAVAVLVAGCGSSKPKGPTQAQQTAAATRCLQNALIAQHLNDAGANCAQNFTQYNERDWSLTATCVHQDANQYVCQAVVAQNTLFQGETHSTTSYDVTYDGQHIEYQPAQ